MQQKHLARTKLHSNISAKYPTTRFFSIISLLVMLAVYVLGENTVMYENISSTKTKRNFHFFVLKSKENCLSL